MDSQENTSCLMTKPTSTMSCVTGKQNNLSSNKHRASRRKAQDCQGLFTPYTVNSAKRTQNDCRKRVVKSKSSTIRLHSGPTNVDFCPQELKEMILHGRHFAKITSLVSFTNNDSITTVSMLYCVIDNLCCRPQLNLQHPFITSSAMYHCISFSFLPQCAAQASTHVVNGMMVCRPLCAVRGEGGGIQAPVDLNNQIIGISKNNGFLTSPRPLTLSF